VVNHINLRSLHTDRVRRIVFAMPPMGLTGNKGVKPIEFISAAAFTLDDGGNQNVTLPLSGAQFGDIIVSAGGFSGSGSGAYPSLTGATFSLQRIWTGIVQNTWSSGYRVAEAVYGTASQGFGFNNVINWGAAAVFRNATSHVVNSGTSNGNQTNIFPLGSHTESDDTSMSVLFGWMNVNATNNPGTITEPSGYTLAARAQSVNSSYYDRILSIWYRPYDNRGAQSPQWSKSNFDSSDSLYVNARLEA
jgi:hypothetical protein